MDRPETLTTSLSLHIDRHTLEREAIRRGWTLTTLGQAAGISSGTMSRIRNGLAFSPRTLGRIAQALSTTPPLEGIDDLLKVGGQDVLTREAEALTT